MPVIHHAEEASACAPSPGEIRDLADRARARQLTADDIAGGTFTITNNGPFGTCFTVPIINQPQVAILSTDGIARRPVVVDPARRLRGHRHPLGRQPGVSWDHRAFDGAYAVAVPGPRSPSSSATRDWAAEL